MTQNTFGEGDTLNAAVAHLAVAGDGISVDVAAAIHMAGRQEALGLSVFGLVLLAQLREQRQRQGLLGFAGMLERTVIGSAVGLVHQGLPHHTGNIHKVQHGRHLILLSPFLQCYGERILLPVEADKNLLAEAGIPKAGDNGAKHINEDTVRQRNRAGLPDMVEGMRSIPEGLSHCAARFFGHHLGDAGHHERILANGAGGTVILGGAHGNDDNVILLQALLHVQLCHGLIIHFFRSFHVAALGG